MQFRALPTSARIDLHPRQLVGLLRSLNQNRIAMGHGPMQMARASVMTFYTTHGDYHMFVFLGTDQVADDGVPLGMLFQSVPESVPVHAYEPFLALAVELVESQGFDMERVELQHLEGPERDQVVEGLPFAVEHRKALLKPVPAAQAGVPVVGQRPNPFESPPAARGSFRRAGALTPGKAPGGHVPDTEAVEHLSRLLTLF